MKIKSLVGRFNPFGLVEILTRGINWLILPFAGLFVPTEVFGQMVLIYTSVFILTSISIFGQQRIILKFSQENASQGHRAFWIACTLIVLIGIIVFPIFEWLQDDLLWGVGLAGTLMAIQQIAATQARAFGNFSKFWLHRVTLVFARAVAIGYVILSGFTPWLFICAEISAVIIALLINAADFWNKKIRISVTSAPLLKNAVQIGMPITFQTVTLMIVLHYDKFVLGNRSLSEVGQYGYIFMICSSMSFLNAYFVMKFDTLIYQSETFDQARFHTLAYLQKSGMAYVAVAPFLLGVYWIASQLNPDILFLIVPFCLVLMGQIAFNLSQCSSHLLTQLRSFSTLWIVSVFGAAISLTGNSFFTPSFGIIGASWVFLGTMLFFLLALTYTAFRRTD